MLCQSCNERQATNHYRRIINGRKEEAYLCNECAREMGYDDFFSSLSLNSVFGNFLGASTGVPTSLVGVERCPQCSSSYNDIVSSGKVGCGKCYEMFYDRLVNSIENIHGRAVYSGKIPHKAHIDVKVEEEETEKQKLEKALNNAVEKQNYELAAELRDKIKALDKE